MTTTSNTYLLSPSVLKNTHEGIHYGYFSLEDLSVDEQKHLAQFISKRFTEMVQLNADKIGTNRGTQIELYKRVLGEAPGEYRVLIKNGKIGGLLMFKKYKTGQEKINKVARREKFVTDQTFLDPSKGERRQFLELFNKEIDSRDDVSIVLSQVRKDNSQMARALTTLGWKKVNVSQESVQYTLYKNADTYDIWKKQK